MRAMGKPPDERAARNDILDERQIDGCRIALLVSSDRLTAWLQLERLDPGRMCKPEQMVDFVLGSKLRLTKSETERLPDVARGLLASHDDACAVVAQGQAVETWKEIDWLIPMGIGALRDYSDETVDLHEVSQFINVRAGQVLCEWPTPPNPGRNVLGDILDPEPCPFQLGDRVALDPQRASRIIATEPGCARFVKGRLSVEQQLDIPGDLDFKVGNIDFFGDVTIHGSVLDGFHVRAAKNVVIEGGVGASHIEALGNITIKGGVNGVHKGKLQCGGDLRAHYLHMVTAECGGDVSVDVECHDSLVTAAGSITVSQGGIIGGQVTAGTDIQAGVIGAEMCVPTTVQAGHQPALDARTERARKSLAHAVALVKNLESALAKLVEQPGQDARFPSQRKTQVIQLQSRLGDARAATKRVRAELAGYLMGAALVGASIASAKQIFPKVRVVIDSVCEEEVMSEIAGPVRLGSDATLLAIVPLPPRRG
jgi:uncharacterized protein (DUF342 family)